MYNLCKEGEDGDPKNGPQALLWKKKNDKKDAAQAKFLQDRINILKAQAQEDMNSDWYKEAAAKFAASKPEDDNNE